MRLAHALIGLSLIVGTTVAAGQAPGRRSDVANLGAVGAASQASAGTFPEDIHPETGNRFPAVEREALDDTGKRLYDARGVGDAFGPGPIRLYSPPMADAMADVNDYLRRRAGVEPKFVELAILVTAREMDSEYVWTAHEPAALKVGLAQEAIDAVKHRRPLTKMGDKEAVIIQLGRDAISKHQVSSDTFARAVKLFGNQGVVNILSLMGNYAATTILLNAADQHVRPSQKSLLPIP